MTTRQRFYESMNALDDLARSIAISEQNFLNRMLAYVSEMEALELLSPEVWESEGKARARTQWDRYAAEVTRHIDYMEYITTESERLTHVLEECVPGMRTWGVGYTFGGREEAKKSLFYFRRIQTNLSTEAESIEARHSDYQTFGKNHHMGALMAHLIRAEESYRNMLNQRYFVMGDLIEALAAQLEAPAF